MNRTRYFSTTSLNLLKKNRPETIYTFSTTYPRGQQSKRGGRKGSGFTKQPSRLKLTPIRAFKKYQSKSQSTQNAHISHGNSISGNVKNRQNSVKSQGIGRIPTTTLRNNKYEKETSSTAFSKTFSQHAKPIGSANAGTIDPRFQLEGSRFIQYMAAQTASDVTEVTSFHKFGLNPMVINAIKAQGFEKPTKIQSISISTLLDPNQDVYIGSETGSGKTMTYLASIFHHLVTEDQADLKLNPTNPLSFRKLKRPRAVILVPSKQLVQQVTEIAKSMSHSARLRVLGMHSKNQSKLTRSEVEDKLKTPIDILICTPGAFAWLSNGSERVRKDEMSEKTKPDIKRGFGVTLSKCKHLIVDECDTLFDTKQVSEAEEIFQPLISRKKEFIKQENNNLTVSTLARPVLNCQFILVSATLPVTLFSYLEKTFPNLKKLTTPSLHRTATTLKQNFIQVHASTTKENILIDILKRSIMNGDKRILVFTNRLNRVDPLVFKLAENQFNVFGASSSTDRQKQRPKLEAFMKHASADASPQIPLKEYVKGSIEDASDLPFSIEVDQPMICVTTDMFSRGLDTMSCTHVVMFDFPITTIDYIHRAGRTARNGTYGQVTSIVGKKERELATAIEFAYKKKQALTSGNIKK